MLRLLVLLLSLLDISLSLLAGFPSEGSSRIYELKVEDWEHEIHSLSKRSIEEKEVAPPTVSNLTSAFRLNNSHLHVLVHWVGKGSPVIFCLTRVQEMKPGATSKVEIY